MSRSLTASDRKALIRLASTLPKGSDERRAVLAGLMDLGGTGTTAQVREDIEEFLSSIFGHQIKVMKRGDVMGVREEGNDHGTSIEMAMDLEGRWTIKAQFETSGKVSHIPYEDHDEYARDFVRERLGPIKQWIEG